MILFKLKALMLLTQNTMYEYLTLINSTTMQLDKLIVVIFFQDVGLPYIQGFKKGKLKNYS